MIAGLSAVRAHLRPRTPILREYVGTYGGVYARQRLLWDFQSHPIIYGVTQSLLTSQILLVRTRDRAEIGSVLIRRQLDDTNVRSCDEDHGEQDLISQPAWRQL
jgi:hypothetical protein